MFRKKTGIRGFTLIELLVVISIIALLSSVVLASLNTARSKSRDAKRRLELSAVRNALALYYNTNGSYPVGRSFSVWDGNTWSLPASVGSLNLYNALVGGKYISKLPTDPTNVESAPGNYLGDGPTKDQGYVYDSDGNTFILGTNIENGGGALNDLGNYEITN